MFYVARSTSCVLKRRIFSAICLNHIVGQGRGSLIKEIAKIFTTVINLPPQSGSFTQRRCRSVCLFVCRQSVASAAYCVATATKSVTDVSSYVKLMLAVAGAHKRVTWFLPVGVPLIVFVPMSICEHDF